MRNPFQTHFHFTRQLTIFRSANLLFPQENQETHELMFACKTCQYSEKATSACVYRNNLDTSIGETAGVTTDVGSDPTVGLPDFCTLCGQPMSCVYCENVLGEAKPQDTKNTSNTKPNEWKFEELSEWAADDGDEENELGERKVS